MTAAGGALAARPFDRPYGVVGEAMGLLREGLIGDVYLARAVCYLGPDEWVNPEEQLEIARTGIGDPRRITLEIHNRERGGSSAGTIFYGSKGTLVIDDGERYRSFLGKEQTPGPSRVGG